MFAPYLLASACLVRLLSAQESEHPQQITKSQEDILPLVANFTPVDVAVYYETLCSDSRNFIIHQLLPSYLKGPHLINFTLIPYGKAQTWLTPWGYVFTCQHGPTECKGNKIHACAAVIVEDKEQQLRFVECMIRNDTVPEAAGQDCARKLNITWRPILQCSRGLEGTGLLKRCGDATHALYPRLTFVPTVTLNGSQGNQTAILNDLWGEVCAIFPALGDDVEKAIDAALEIGYRHIDTAQRYNNEVQIGKALKKWLDSGKVKREDLFIVTKLPSTGNRAESVEKHLKQSLSALQLDYVDLYLIHHPVGFHDVDPKDNGGKMLLDTDTDHISLWKAMEAQVDAGRTRSIGLSNFNARQVKRIWQSARIRPTNLQVEMHAYFQQSQLRAFCKALDITVCAYIPLGAPGVRPPGHASNTADASKQPKRDQLTNPVVSQIAQKHGKTNAQVLLRHLIQLGVAVIPKSTNPDRLRQNFDVFDFELSPEDMDAMERLDKGPAGRQVRAFIPEMANHPEYPFNERY